MKRRENLVVLNERDLITLNAYVDGVLSPPERAAFEKRLASDPNLQQEMDTLKATVALLHKVERVRVPRNFTLDPAKYGSSARRSVLDRLGFISLPQLVAAGGTLAAVMICVGLIAYGSGLRTAAVGAPEAAMVGQDAMADEALPEEALREATEEFNSLAAEDEYVPCDPEIAGPCPETAIVPPGASTTGGHGGGDTSGQSGSTGGPAASGPVISPQPVEPTFAGPYADTTEVTEESSAEDAAESSYVESGADNSTTRLSEGDDDSNVTDPVRFPLVPLALGGLVIVLAAGMLVARRARRR
jgi:hypothetical protein